MSSAKRRPRIGEILNVVGHRHAQFNNRRPGFTVVKLDMPTSPQGFDHGMVVAIADCSKAELKTAVTRVARERQGRKSRAMIRMDGRISCF